MDIVLFSLGIILVIISFPLCFSCEIKAAWEKVSKPKANQPNQSFYQHAKRNRTIGLFSIIIGVLLIIFSLSGINSVDYILASNRAELQILLSL